MPPTKSLISAFNAPARYQRAGRYYAIFASLAPGMWHVGEAFACHYVAKIDVFPPRRGQKSTCALDFSLSRREFTRFAWAGGTCPRFAWARGTFFPVVLLCQFWFWREIGFGCTYYYVLGSSCGVVLVFLVLAGNSIWCYVRT